MRFYDLQVLNAAGKTLLHFSSYPNGTYDPGALNVQFDIIASPGAVPQQGATIRIEGVDPTMLTNAQNYGMQYFKLYGGMAQGLPLAQPSQIGLIAQGQILQVFANWVGTQIDLSMVVAGANVTFASPGNVVLNWTAGAPLATALKQTLQTAWPKMTPDIHIGNIVLNHDVKHAAYTFSGLARFVAQATPNNVQMVMTGSTIRVWDDTYAPTVKMLAFNDLIGQPMWVGGYTIQAWFALRGDIQVGDSVQMPQGFANLNSFMQQTAASFSSLENYRTAIQGKFIVNQVRHLGDLRNPQGQAWATIINAATTPPSGATQP